MTAGPKLSLEEIKAKVRVVCICKGVKMGRMCDAIHAGAKTVAEVHKATNSGDGGCGATRCTPVIQELLANGGRPFPKRDEPDNSDDDWTLP